MKCRVGTVLLRVHPLLPLLWGAAWLTGGGKNLFPALLALLLHEYGHVIAAKALRIPVNEIEVTPFGGVMALDGLDAAPPLSRFLEAGAGPLFSLLGCLLSAGLYQSGGMPLPFASVFFRANLTLLLINLLPALPLDGGQMLRAGLQRFFPFPAVTRILTALAFLLGGAFCAFSLYFAFQGEFVLFPIFAGLYLMYASAIEQRQSTAHYVTALIARRQKLERQDVLPVEIVAASGEMTARRLLRQLHPGRYHIIYVLSRDGMRSGGILEEQDFCDAVLAHNDQTLMTVLQANRTRP